MENKDRKNYVLKGNVCYTPTRDKFCIVENGYVVCKEGRCAGVYETLPQEYESLPCMDYGDRLIFPGFACTCATICVSWNRDGFGTH